MQVVIFLKRLCAETLGLADEIAALFNREGRNARVREGEMVGPVIGALLRARVRPDREAHTLSYGLDHGPCRGSLGAAGDCVPRAAEWKQAVVIQRQRSLARRN